MAKVKLYNQEAKEVGELELSDAVFGVKLKAEVIYQVYNAMMANAREPWAHTKNKGEVRGGGRKPWKQKGFPRSFPLILIGPNCNKTAFLDGSYLQIQID